MMAVSFLAAWFGLHAGAFISMESVGFPARSLGQG